MINCRRALCNLFEQLNGGCAHSTGCCNEPDHLMYQAVKTRYVALGPRRAVKVEKFVASLDLLTWIQTM